MVIKSLKTALLSPLRACRSTEAANIWMWLVKYILLFLSIATFLSYYFNRIHKNKRCCGQKFLCVGEGRMFEYCAYGKHRRWVIGYGDSVFFFLSSFRNSKPRIRQFGFDLDSRIRFRGRGKQGRGEGGKRAITVIGSISENSRILYFDSQNIYALLHPYFRCLERH